MATPAQLFGGYANPEQHRSTWRMRARCLVCADWCYPSIPCYCCRGAWLASLTDAQVAELPDCAELAAVLAKTVQADLAPYLSYGSRAEVAVATWDPRPLAVQLYRQGWSKP